MAAPLNVTREEFAAGIRLKIDERHRLVVFPQPLLVTLGGQLFDSNKAFLLPTALPALRKLKTLYAQNAPSELLIVGHTDTSGEPEFNDRLSLVRAQSVMAFLTDTPEPWLAMYETSVAAGERWGAQEDALMLAALPALVTRPAGVDEVSFYQRLHNATAVDDGRPLLEEDGLIGPKTRQELILDYMALDGASAKRPEVNITCHGCGENFPLDASGAALELAAQDGETDAADRRVELFFFKKVPGIVPPPPGDNSAKGSTEYPTWRRRARLMAALDTRDAAEETLSSTLPLEQLAGAAKIMAARHFVAWLTSIYGYDIPDQAYHALRQELLNGSYRMPAIVLVSNLDGEHVAGYDRDSQQLKLLQAFVARAETDENEAARLLAALIEEFGHHLDHDLRTRLSTVGGDAQLDEGASFGYAICNLGWDLRAEAVIATYLRAGVEVTLRVRWPVFKQAIQQVFSPEERRSDDMKGAIEFFGAGRGHGKPGQSFAHESIEDALPDEFGDTGRREIYFGNWLRDYSQALTPVALELLAIGGAIADASLPGTSASSRLQTDPRGVLTDILDLYARAEFKDLPHFRVTRARLGVYRSPEHIDNPTGLSSSSRDPDFDRAPTPEQLGIDTLTQQASYIAGSLTRPAQSALDYLREELAAAVSAGPTAEGRRRFGQALHTLEDFYAHSNFCELGLRSVGQSAIEPWTVSVSRDGKSFFPLVTGCFGGADTAASIFLTLGELLEAEKDQECQAGKRGLGVKIALVLLRDLRPHLAQQAEAALADFENFQKAHPVLANLVCRTIGTLIRFVHWLFGVVTRLLANQIDEAQALSSGPSTNPTHTQLAKDHDDHPLHGLAAECAMIAVKDMGQLMLAAWKQPLVARQALTASIQDKAASYFIHPELILPGPVGSPELLQIKDTLQRFADSPANAAALARASQRSVLDSHLKEIREFGTKATQDIPLERLQQMFGL